MADPRRQREQEGQKEGRGGVAREAYTPPAEVARIKPFRNDAEAIEDRCVGQAEGQRGGGDKKR